MNDNDNSSAALKAQAALKERAQQNADLELRTRMCKGEIEAVLQKYGLIVVIRELRINGQMAEIGWALGQPAPQGGKLNG